MPGRREGEREALRVCGRKALPQVIPVLFLKPIQDSRYLHSSTKPSLHMGQESLLGEPSVSWDFLVSILRSELRPGALSTHRTSSDRRGKAHVTAEMPEALVLCLPGSHSPGSPGGNASLPHPAVTSSPCVPVPSPPRRGTSATGAPPCSPPCLPVLAESGSPLC